MLDGCENCNPYDPREQIALNKSRGKSWLDKPGIKSIDQIMSENDKIVQDLLDSNNKQIMQKYLPLRERWNIYLEDTKTAEHIENPKDLVYAAVREFEILLEHIKKNNEDIEYKLQGIFGLLKYEQDNKK